MNRHEALRSTVTRQRATAPARVACRAARSIGFTFRSLTLIAALTLLSGCQQLRLPAIDPTGACLFAPKPTATSLALPCSGGEGCKCLVCLHGLKAKLHGALHHGGPKPAFTAPAEPPPCAPQQLPNSGRVISPPGTCTDCVDGPPAVLYGDEVLGKRPHHKLPDQGTRGSILLSPQQIVAPVGGEVILLSGICGDDGFLQVGQPLEWMMTQDSVGNFIEVGNDSPGMLHKLASIEKADKRSGTFAIGVTSTKRSLITRGNRNQGDDVSLEKGQTWLSLSSPNEGVSRVTVLAPQSDCWDQRKATATIYWIDARWQFPGAQRVLAGTPVTLSTRVTRSEGTLPARGWTVRYEILNPEVALFVTPGAAAGSGGSTTVDVPVDTSGNATAELIPIRLSTGNFASGTAAIRMQIVRPGNNGDNLPDLPLGAGQTFITWSAPQLELRAAAPAVATFDQPVEVVANIRNTGDQPANNVTVSVALPPGSRVTQSDSFARVTPSNITWEIGTIPPRTQLDLFMSLASQSSSRLQFQARGDDSLFAEGTVAIDVYRPSLAIRVNPSTAEPVEVGSPVTFNIDVTNTGDRALSGVNLRAVGDNAMTHTQTGSRVIGQNKADGPLQPGATWSSAVTFVSLEAGRRCVIVEAFADGGQQTQGEGCATVINRIVPVPAITATVSGPEQVQTSAVRLFSYRVVNTGQVPLSNVRITVTFDSSMQLIEATEGSDLSRLSQFQIGWNIPAMPVAPDIRSSVLLEGKFLATRVAPQSLMILTVESAEGARASDSFQFQIIPGAPASPAVPQSTPIPQATPQPPSLQPATPAPPTLLPPVIPLPTIPSSPAPIPADPSFSTPALPSPPPGAVPTNTLSLSLLDRDDPVRVGEPIRYALAVQNTGGQPDGAVGLRFKMPPGVELTRVAQRYAPTSNQFRREGDTIYLEEIRDLRAGETIDYEIELVSNQPQQIQLTVEAISRLVPSGAIANQSTRVLP